MGQSNPNQHESALWGGGSRHRAVERYIFGSQPRVQEDNHQEVGRPQDVRYPASGVMNEMGREDRIEWR